MSIYVNAIRNLLYSRSDLFNFLIVSGLYDRYHDAVVILQRLRELLENGQVEELLSKMDKIDKLRAFVIDYVVTYLLFKNPNNKELASRIAEIINYQIGTLVNYISATIEMAIRAKGEINRVLLVSRIMSYFSDLLSMFEEILLGNPEDIITYLMFRANYISALIESRSSVASKLKELGETIEEAAEELRKSREETSKQPEITSTLSSIASDLKYEYLRSATGTTLPVFKKIFNKDELKLLGILLQRGSVYPKGGTSLDTLARELNMDEKEVLRLINAILDKCKDFDISFIIRTDRVVDESGKEVVYVYIDPDAFKRSINKLSKAHPELVDLFVKLGYGI